MYQNKTRLLLRSFAITTLLLSTLIMSNLVHAKVPLYPIPTDLRPCVAGKMSERGYSIESQNAIHGIGFAGREYFEAVKACEDAKRTGQLTSPAKSNEKFQPVIEQTEAEAVRDT